MTEGFAKVRAYQDYRQRKRVQIHRVPLLDIHRQISEQPVLREYEARLLWYRTEQTSQVGKATVQQVRDDTSIWAAVSDLMIQREKPCQRGSAFFCLTKHPLSRAETFDRLEYK